MRKIINIKDIKNQMEEYQGKIGFGIWASFLDDVEQHPFDKRVSVERGEIVVWHIEMRRGIKRQDPIAKIRESSGEIYLELLNYPTPKGYGKISQRDEAVEVCGRMINKIEGFENWLKENFSQKNTLRRNL